MKLSVFFKYKLVAIIGVLVSLPYLLTTSRDLFWGLAWLICSIFTWMKKTWAISLLLLLAIIAFYTDIIVEISTLEESIHELAADFNIERETAYVLGIVVFTLEALILAYVILVGAFTVVNNLRKADKL